MLKSVHLDVPLLVAMLPVHTMLHLTHSSTIASVACFAHDAIPSEFTAITRSYSAKSRSRRVCSDELMVPALLNMT